MQTSKILCLLPVFSIGLFLVPELLAATEGSRCEDAVNRILTNGTLQTNQKVDLVTNLGADCVPVVLRRLEDVDIGSPSATLIRTLGSIGDTQATIPLLSRLAALSPNSDADGEHSTEAMLIIDALGDIGDPVASSALRQILSSDGSATESRIAAAHALLKLGQESDRNQAIDYLIALANPPSSAWEKANGRFDLRQLDRAIAAIGNNASRKILVGRLEDCGTSYEQMAIIELIADNIGDDEELALLRIIGQDNFEWFVRTKATHVLLQNYSAHPSEEFRTRFLATLDSMEGKPTEGDFKEAVEEAEIALNGVTH